MSIIDDLDPLNIVGEMFGKVEILGCLGKGGMGVVYLGKHQMLDKYVAVKVLPINPLMAPDARERFLREARSAASLEHPNIVQVYDVEQAEGFDYIIMQFIQGQTIGDLIFSQGSLEMEEVFEIMEQSLEGLAFAHEKGVIHRDIKPDNIMVTGEGQVKIADFGLSRQSEGETMTESGLIMGTPEYMAPEQAEGRRVDQRADIYSLGVTLYVMIRGEVPFEGETPLSIIMKKIDTNVPRLAEFREEVPSQLEEMIEKMMAVEREERYDSCQEILGELKKVRTSKSSDSLSRLTRSMVIEDLSRRVAAPTQPQRVSTGEGEESFSPEKKEKKGGLFSLSLSTGLLILLLLSLVIGTSFYQINLEGRAENELKRAQKAYEKGDYFKALRQAERAQSYLSTQKGEKLILQIEKKWKYMTTVLEARRALEKKNYLKAEKKARLAEDLSEREDGKEAKRLLMLAKHGQANDVFEPNDSSLSAWDFRKKTFPQKLVLTPREEDWFILRFEQGKYYAVSIDGQGKGDLDLELYKNPEEVWDFSHSPKNRELLLIQAEKEDYYIRIFDAQGRGGDYTLEVREVENLPPRQISGFSYLGTFPSQGEKKKGEIHLYRHNLTGMEFSYLPGDSFMMGTNNKSWNKKAQPVHKVKLKPYLIGRREVTQAVWYKFMKTRPWSGEENEKFIKTGPDYPALFVTWHQAQKFCQKVGLNLPSEAQWEYAARAGTKTRYYWGNELDPQYGWFQVEGSENKIDHPQRVGQKKPNPFGLYDMSGNVAEWCADSWHSSYKSAPSDGRPWREKRAQRYVIRGGGWSSGEDYTSSFRRTWYDYTGNTSNIGFRCIYKPVSNGDK